MEALIIQMEALVPSSHLKIIYDNITKQLKTGVVIIPAYAKVKLVNVPDDVQVIVKQYKKEDKKNDVWVNTESCIIKKEEKK